ncbi:MAG: hypothetical protein OXH72_06795 [Caldilineaceae bacterium]|nr:hypothetical protein [Caldilineaceae bacterium]
MALLNPIASGSQAVKARAVCQAFNDATLLDAATITCFNHLFHFQLKHHEESDASVHVIEVSARNLRARRA